MGVYFKGSKYAFLVYMYASFSNGGQYLMDRICSYGIFTLHVFRKKNKKKTKKKKTKKIANGKEKWFTLQSYCYLQQSDIWDYTVRADTSLIIFRLIMAYLTHL